MRWTHTEINKCRMNAAGPATKKAAQAAAAAIERENGPSALVGVFSLQIQVKKGRAIED